MYWLLNKLTSKEKQSLYNRIELNWSDDDDILLLRTFSFRWMVTGDLVNRVRVDQRAGIFQL